MENAFNEKTENAEELIEKSQQDTGLNEDSVEKELSEEEKQRQEFEKLQAEVKENNSKFLRALAEVENIKKRSQRERDEYLKYGKVSLIQKILPVIDDLNRAMEASQQSSDYESLSKGVELIAKSLDDILRNEGVEEIESIGKAFDPRFHQALMVEANEEYPENMIIEELQKGYILHDRVIRPGLVKVSG